LFPDKEERLDEVYPSPRFDCIVKQKEDVDIVFQHGFFNRFGAIRIKVQRLGAILLDGLSLRFGPDQSVEGVYTDGQARTHVDLV
ncbi:hypothetical protein KCV07_g160, partial [Aureobasidium melanogenum]